MADFFRRSTTWAVDYRYDGRHRRIFKVMLEGTDVRASMLAELRELYGDRVELGETRLATDDEEHAYLRGEHKRNALCPTGDAPVSNPPQREIGRD